ncbi:hypothetical protein ZHAS_00010824 [Anopheles sinensis]|uniref:Uncharacterized protein n=1 Tax=Anopheles sinensis TaxID=74873 RepID=A0A084VYA7_ANOSI|nr:hypothetical protein ZHAS_00010824 [Anopheles sinensis]
MTNSVESPNNIRHQSRHHAQCQCHPKVITYRKQPFDFKGHRIRLVRPFARAKTKTTTATTTTMEQVAGFVTSRVGLVKFKSTYSEHVHQTAHTRRRFSLEAPNVGEPFPRDTYVYRGRGEIYDNLRTPFVSSARAVRWKVLDGCHRAGRAGLRGAGDRMIDSF